jgi:hypothetical protein
MHDSFSASSSTFMGSQAVNKMMNMFRGRSASSATAEDKRRLQAKVGKSVRSSTPVLQFMSLDGVGNWKAGNSVGDGSAKGDSRISLG